MDSLNNIDGPVMKTMLEFQMAKHRKTQKGSRRIDVNSPGGRVYIAISDKGYPSMSAFLRDLEEKKGILIESSNFSPFVYNEKGLGDTRDMSKIIAVAELLGVTLDYIYSGKEDGKDKNSYLYRQTEEVARIMDDIPSDDVRDDILKYVNERRVEYLTANDNLAKLNALIDGLSKKLSATEYESLRSAIAESIG